MRAPLQILLFPFIKEGDKYLYAIFKRKDLDIWQGIAGGAEDDETPLEAAKREAYEEARIDQNSNFIRLASVATIPAANIRGTLWGDIIAIPEISFGVELSSKEIKIGDEHTEYQWLSCEEALTKLEYDSNKSALWELDYRLKNGGDGSKNIEAISKYYL